MQLSNIFSANKHDKPVFILCIILTDASTQTLLLKLQESRSSIASKSKRYHYLDSNSLVVKTDEGLQELGPESEKVNTVVFVLEESWIKDGVVQPKQQKLIDSLVKDLSLKPVGFIEQTEALSHAFAVERSSENAILLLTSQATITAILIQQGKVLGKQSIGKSGDMTADVTEALARLHQNKGTLPTKIYCLSTLLTDEELETAQQELLAVDWQSNGFFLRQPSIEFFSEEATLELLSQQAAIAARLAVTQTTKSQTQSSAQTIGDNFQPVELAVEAEPKVAKSFGIPIPTNQTKDPDFGFSEDVALEEQEDEDIFSEEISHKPHKFIGIGVVLGLVVLAILAFAGIYFWSSAVVYLTPVSKTVSREVEVGLDASATFSDPENLLIKAEQYESEFTVTKTTDTSGVALVGEKATGEVTLFNETEAEKTFPAGTKLGFQELVFTLDDPVTVPAATVSTKEGGGGKVIDYGQKTAKVTATVIGAESNLAKNTQFSVASFSQDTYFAKNTEEFTGGASREVRVVSATDLKSLISDAKKDALNQAKAEFSQQSGSGRYLLPPQQVEVVSKRIDKKEGDEADSVTAEVKTTVKTLAYKTEDLLPVVHAVLQSEVPDGFVLKDREPEILSAANQTADLTKKITLSVNMSAQIVAIINADQLRAKILGESFTTAKNILMSDNKIQNASIEINPSVVSLVWKRIPRKAEHVIMKIEGEKGE